MHAMKPDWTLIANSTRARLLRQEPGSPMTILESFIHPASCPLPPGVGAMRKDLMEFARELGHLLEQEAQLDHFSSLTIFASSPFLGELEEQIGKCTRRLLAGVHEMDLTGFTLSEIEERIAHEVAAPAR
jgi:Bacterial archaeo-eukaryotic release factor family 12